MLNGSLARFSSFWLYPALSLVLLWATRPDPVETGRAQPWTLLWLIPVGCVLWTLIEYLLHRFVFHSRSVSRRLGGTVAGFHRLHHARPRDPAFILARPAATLPLSLGILGLLYAATGNARDAVGVMIGVWAGFLMYEWLHYRMHTSSSETGLGRLRGWHFRHHFVDEGAAYGVTSGFWDRVFGTARVDQRNRNESRIASKAAS
jgi:sterol desaturase/sphingolipid hydroxylase (fatty acid hydroxylase superfamily)